MGKLTPKCNYKELRRMLRAASGDHRVRASREFFRLDPYKARVVIKLLALEEVIPGMDVVDKEGEIAL